MWVKGQRAEELGRRMKEGEGGDELGEAARAGGGETRSFWQPAIGRLGRESAVRLANRAGGHESAVRFSFYPSPKKQKK